MTEQRQSRPPREQDERPKPSKWKFTDWAMI
jgi:hypothetical protein